MRFSYQDAAHQGGFIDHASAVAALPGQRPQASGLSVAAYER